MSQATTTRCRPQLWPLSGGRNSKLSCHFYACLCTIPPQSDACDFNVVLCVAEQPRYDTAYACEGKTLKLECKDGELIHLIRANYGRFSITICNDHGNTDWSVNCMSTKSLRVLYSRYCVCMGPRSLLETRVWKLISSVRLWYLEVEGVVRFTTVARHVFAVRTSAITSDNRCMTWWAMPSDPPGVGAELPLFWANQP